MFYSFYLLRNHKVANNSATTEAREKISTFLECLEFMKYFDVCTNIVFICKTDKSKPVKQEVNGTVIRITLVYPAQSFHMMQLHNLWSLVIMTFHLKLITTFPNALPLFLSTTKTHFNEFRFRFWLGWFPIINNLIII